MKRISILHIKHPTVIMLRSTWASKDLQELFLATTAFGDEIQSGENHFWKLQGAMGKAKDISNQIAVTEKNISKI